MMPTPEYQIGWRKWITWTLISAGGWLLACVGSAVLVTILQLAFVIPTSRVVQSVYTSLTAITCGAIGGSCQWILLRHAIRHAYRWIIATIIGWLIGALLLEAIFVLVGIPMHASIQFSIAIVLAVIGLFQGIGQWYLLRRESRGLWWWPLATTSTGILAGVIWYAIFDALNEGVRLATLNDPFADESRSIGAVMSAAQATAVTGIVIGLITGIGLSVLITRLDISHQAARLDHNQR